MSSVLLTFVKSKENCGDSIEVFLALNTTVQRIQSQIYDLEGMAHANEVLTRSKSSVMVQLAQINVTMNATQAQLKTL